VTSQAEAGDVALLLAEVFGWSAIAAGGCGVALRVGWLARTRAGRASHGAHVRPEDAEPYGTRRAAWSSTRFLLPGIAALACELTGHKDAARWVVTVLLLVAIAPDVMSWLKSRRQHKPGGPRAEPSPTRAGP
jgi:hypothetical protein